MTTARILITSKPQWGKMGLLARRFGADIGAMKTNGIKIFAARPSTTKARTYQPHIYGHANRVKINEVRKLSLKVADIYRQLTTYPPQKKQRAIYLEHTSSNQGAKPILPLPSHCAKLATQQT